MFLPPSLFLPCSVQQASSLCRRPRKLALKKACDSYGQVWNNSFVRRKPPALPALTSVFHPTALALTRSHP